MSEDLAAKVLAAIGETERIAQEAIAEGDPGRWHAYEDAVSPGVLGQFARDFPVAPPPESRGDWYEIFHWDLDGDQIKHQSRVMPYAVHIARHDPASALRRCAADRKLVELHKLGISGW